MCDFLLDNFSVGEALAILVGALNWFLFNSQQKHIKQLEKSLFKSNFNLEKRFELTSQLYELSLLAYEDAKKIGDAEYIPKFRLFTEDQIKEYLRVADLSKEDIDEILDKEDLEKYEDMLSLWPKVSLRRALNSKKIMIEHFRFKVFVFVPKIRESYKSFEASMEDLSLYWGDIVVNNKSAPNKEYSNKLKEKIKGELANLENSLRKDFKDKEL